MVVRIEQEFAVDPFQSPQESVDHAAKTIDDMRYGFATRLKEIASERVSSLDEIPGANVLASLGVRSDEAKELSKNWRVLRFTFGGMTQQEKISLIREIKSAGGEVLAIPHASLMRFEVFVAAPSPTQAIILVGKVKTQFNEKLMDCGVQRSSGVYGKIAAQCPAFYGKGIDSVRESIDQELPSIPSRDMPETFDRQGENEPEQYLGNQLRRITDLSVGPGAVAIIELQGYGGNRINEEEKRLIYDELISLVDRSTDTITWLGEKITITTKTENAARKLAARLSKIIRIHKDAVIKVKIAHGNLELGEIGCTKYVESDAFDEAEALQATHRGIVVSMETYKELTKFRGANVRAVQQKGQDAVELLEVDERISEIKTEGPSELIGRQELFHQALEQIEDCKKKNKFIIVEGMPGVGKSRFLEELSKVIDGKKGSVQIKTVAQQEDRTRQYSFIDNFITTLLQTLEKEAKNPNYQLLLRTEIRRGSPERLAYVIAELIKSSKNSTLTALELDDLQWCDEKSASVVAMLVTSLEGFGQKNVLTVLSAREVAGEMPATIKTAIEGVDKFSVLNAKIQPLPFAKEKDLLMRYVEKSFEHEDGVKLDYVPQAFWQAMATLHEGIPYSITRSLIKMEERGAIFVDEGGFLRVKDDIKYEDYAGGGLFTSMITECPESERTVLQAFRIFNGCRVKERLFIKLFPELSAFLETLIYKGMIVRKDGYVQPNHSLLREAIEKTFDQSKLSVLAFDIYRAVSQNEKMSEMMTHEEKFALIKSLLQQVGEEKGFEDLYEAAGYEGVEALREMSRDCRHGEVVEVVEMLRNKKGVKLDERSQGFMSSAMEEAYFSMGNGRKMSEEIETLLKGSLAPRDKVKLLISLCDSYYLANDSENFQMAIATLSAETSYISALERRYPDLLVRMNYVKLFYLRDEYEDAIRECANLLTEIKEEFRITGIDDENPKMAAFRLERLPIEQARLYFEAERFFIKLKSESLKIEREKSDADAAYTIKPTDRDESEELQLLALRSEKLEYILKAAQIPITRTLKDNLSSRFTTAQIQALSGNFDQAIKCAEEAARLAEMSGDLPEAAVAYKLLGDVLLSFDSNKLTPEIVERAKKAYKKATTLMETRSGERHRNWASYAGSIPRAVAMKAAVSDEISEGDLKEGWLVAMDVYGELMGDKRHLPNVMQYIVPPMIEIKRLLAEKGILVELPTTPVPIESENLDRIRSRLNTFLEDCAGEERFVGLSAELSRKIVWLGSLTKGPETPETPETPTLPAGTKERGDLELAFEPNKRQ